MTRGFFHTVIVAFDYYMYVVHVHLLWVKGALRPSNAKRLYMDEKSTEIGEVN